MIVNSEKERVSIAFFWNPVGNIPIEPAKELIKEEEEEPGALYQAMTFNEYRMFIRRMGPCGKLQVNSLHFPR